jgi:hypothetical protein
VGRFEVGRGDQVLAAQLNAPPEQLLGVFRASLGGGGVRLR